MRLRVLRLGSLAPRDCQQPREWSETRLDRTNQQWAPIVQNLDTGISDP